VNAPIATILMRKKHSLPIMVAVYESGVTCTSDLVRQVHGHPMSIINTVRALEQSGVLSRVRLHNGRHPVETRLTLRGIQLVETPIYRWDDLFRKWDRMAD
jgi:DNA-binding HxlR family transcriptional regulator